MAKARILRADFFRSRSLSRCTRDARTTFQGLWIEADDAGRGLADPRILKGAIWPLDDDITPDMVEAHLWELEAEHIVLYEVDGERYFQVLSWEKHQAAAYRRADPKFPAHTDGTRLHAPAHAGVQAAHQSVLEVKERKGKLDADQSHTESGFAAFYARYPRKVGRGAAENAYRRAVASGGVTHEQLIAALDAQRLERKEQKFIPHPATWLNRKGWDDEVEHVAPVTHLFGSTQTDEIVTLPDGTQMSRWTLARG